MTQALEKLSANIYVLWSAILFSAAGAWATCAYLGGISAQIVEVSHKVEMTNGKVDSLSATQDQTKEWIKAVSVKVDTATDVLNAHDLALQKQADQLEAMKQAIDRDAAANRASQK